MRQRSELKACQRGLFKRSGQMSKCFPSFQPDPGDARSVGTARRGSSRGVVMATPVQVRARLLPDPPLWCWELIDPSTGSVVTSSWTEWWVAYPSSDAALRAANRYHRRKAARTTASSQRDAA